MQRKPDAAAAFGGKLQPASRGELDRLVHLHDDEADGAGTQTLFRRGERLRLVCGARQDDIARVEKRRKRHRIDLLGKPCRLDPQHRAAGDAGKRCGKERRAGAGGIMHPAALERKYGRKRILHGTMI